MKKFFATMALSLAVAATAGVIPVMAAEEDAQSWAATDWKPHNYVLSEGFGLSAKKVDVRSNLSYANNQLTVSGTTSKGGVGVTFAPEVELDGFSMELSLDKWQQNSTDKWFGITFLDKGERSDIYNEVPFWSKHSESWSNDYGAGTLFAWRPSQTTPGMLQIQFNNIGIQHSWVDAAAADEINPDAGKRADGVLGWSGYLSNIQLCDEDWNELTDYSKVKITIREIEEGGQKGYAFDINDGYWYREESSIVWPTTESDPELYDQLDIDQNGNLDDWEKKLFQYGPAYEDTEHGEEPIPSWVPYANWGDPMYSLYNFNQIVKGEGGRLYVSALYKDAFDMQEGEAQFTIKSVNGKAATASETLDLNASKSVDANGIKATVAAENTHAGVYPSMLTGLTAKAADEADVAKVQDAINAKRAELGVGTAEPVNFYGQVSLSGETKDVEIIDDLTISYDATGKENFKVYKVTGTDLDEVTTTMDGSIATFDIKDSSSMYILMYDGGNGGSSRGCRGVSAGIAPLLGTVLALGAVTIAAIKVKKR